MFNLPKSIPNPYAYSDEDKTLHPHQVGYQFLKWGDLPEWLTHKKYPWNSVTIDPPTQDYPKVEKQEIPLFESNRLTIPRTEHYGHARSRWGYVLNADKKEDRSVELSTIQLAVLELRGSWTHSMENVFTSTGGRGGAGYHVEIENMSVTVTRNIGFETRLQIFWGASDIGNYLGETKIIPKNADDWKRRHYTRIMDDRYIKRSRELTTTIVQTYTANHVKELVVNGGFRFLPTGEQEYQESLKEANDTRLPKQISLF